VILTVRILRRAIGDLEEIRRYIERDRPDAARRLLARLLVVAESLAVNPERGAQPRDERLRELGYRFVPVRPYLLFYKVGRRVVRVYRVLHGQRRYEDVL
jgi:plasmid stabilization system protein ParE